MQLVSWIFFGPAMLVAAWPFAGILIAAALIAAQTWLSLLRGTLLERKFFREAPVLAGFLWLIFNLYELQVTTISRQNLSGDALRIDLIILVPILYALTFAAALSIRAQLRNNAGDT